MRIRKIRRRLVPPVAKVTGPAKVGAKPKGKPQVNKKKMMVKKEPKEKSRKRRPLDPDAGHIINIKA